MSHCSMGTILKRVHPVGASLFSNFRYNCLSLTVHVYRAGCMVFSGHAPGEDMISNLNFEYWVSRHVCNQTIPECMVY